MALYKNNTGEVSRVGLVAKVDPTDKTAFIYSNPGDSDILGIVTQSVPQYAKCEIATSGITKVFCYERVVSGSIIRAKKSTDRISRGTCKAAKGTDTPYFKIGTALESGKGLVKCSLDLSGGVTIEGYVPYVGAYKDINIGDHFLTGRFIARPGNVSVGLAPLIFQAGDLLTVPEAGTMEFDGTGIYLTPTNHRRFISLASDSVIVTTTATTIIPTILWTGVTNANELKVHRVYVIKGCGLITTHDAADTATIIIAMGGVTIIELVTPAGAVTDSPWFMEVYFTIRTIGVAGTLSAHGEITLESGLSHAVTESIVVNTTIANDVTIIVAWDDVDNSLSLTQAWLAETD